jgi:hypothetical protein
VIAIDVPHKRIRDLNARIEVYLHAGFIRFDLDQSCLETLIEPMRIHTNCECGQQEERGRLFQNG